MILLLFFLFLILCLLSYAYSYKYPYLCKYSTIGMKIVKDKNQCIPTPWYYGFARFIQMFSEFGVDLYPGQQAFKTNK